MILEDTVDVVKSNAVYYSFVESAKSNNLNIYEYLNYLLKEFTQLNEEQI